MNYALIENGIVKDIFKKPEGVNIEDCFHPEIIQFYILCPDDIIEGDFYDQQTQQFTKQPNRKLPNYDMWIKKLTEKTNSLVNFYHSKLSSVTINNLIMKPYEIESYERMTIDHKITQTKISFELKNFVLDYNDSILINKIAEDNIGSEIPSIKFTVDEFQIIVNELINYKNNTKTNYDIHKENLSYLNSVEDIENYDFTSGWPDTNVTV